MAKKQYTAGFRTRPAAPRSAKLRNSSASAQAGAPSVAAAAPQESLFDIVYENDQALLKVKDKFAGLFTTGFLSARGKDSSGGTGGGGSSLEDVWTSLTGNTDAYKDSKINLGHIPAIGMDKVTGLSAALLGKADRGATLAAYGIGDAYTADETDALLSGKSDTGHKHSAADITSGTLATDRIPTIPYSKTSGVQAALVSGTSIKTINGVSLLGSGNIVTPNTTYSSKTAASGGTDLSLVTTGEKYIWNAKQAAISDLATIRSNAANGATAYGWGDHSKAGYLKSIAHLTINGTLYDGTSAVTITTPTYTLSSFGITASATELNYVKGVTSAIQTQLDAKADSSALADYLPLSGGTMSGDITFPISMGLVANAKTTSNWIEPIRFLKGGVASGKTYEAGIGWHSTGGTKGTGTITLIPHAQDTAPWSRTVGLAITEDQLQFNGKEVSLNGHTHTFASLTSKPATLAGYGITDALGSKWLFSKQDYQRYVLLLCRIGTNVTIQQHTINGTFWTRANGSNRYQAAYINIHCSDWVSGHNEYYCFTPFGIGTISRLVTCTYESSQYLAVTFETLAAVSVLFDGSSSNILFTPVLYYTSNTQTVNNSEIYNSIAEVKYDKIPLVSSADTVLDSSNYNNYAPTKTGTGASGTWGISVTGGAKYLIPNNYPTTGASGTAAPLLWFTGQPAIGTTEGCAYKGSSNDYNLWSFPEAGTSYNTSIANIQTLRLSWDKSKYWHDIFASPNGQYLWHRAVTNGTAGDWHRIVEETTSDGWGISITGKVNSFRSVTAPTKSWTPTSTGWYRIATVTMDGIDVVGNYQRYPNLTIKILGMWNQTPSSNALLTFQSRHTRALFTQLSGNIENIDKIRAVQTDSASPVEYYIDIYVRVAGSACSVVFEGLGKVTPAATPSLITDTVTAAHELGLGMIYGTNITDSNYSRYALPLAGGTLTGNLSVAGDSLSIGNSNAGTIFMLRPSNNYIWANTTGGTLYLGTAAGGATGPSTAGVGIVGKQVCIGGTTRRYSTLNVQSNISIVGSSNPLIDFRNSSNATIGYVQAVDAGWMGLGPGGGKGIFVGKDGALTINATPPTTPTGNSIDAPGAIHSITGVYSEGYVSARGVDSSSDERLKTDIKTLENALQYVLGTKYRSFRWKSDNKPCIGVIAQEELGREHGYLVEKHREYYSYNYAATTALIGAALQEEDRKVEALKKKIAELENEVRRLRNTNS